MAETDYEIAVTYTLTEDDFARLCWTVRRKMFFPIAFIVIGIMCLPGICLALSRPVSPEPGQLLQFALFLLSLPLVVFVVIPRLFRRAYRNAYWNNPNVQYETTYRFTRRGIASSNAVSRSEATWKAILAVLETDEDFIFYISKQTALQLPKTAIPSPEQQRLLRRIVMDGVGDRATLQWNEDEVEL
jgi:hypothetical protein